MAAPRNNKNPSYPSSDVSQEPQLHFVRGTFGQVVLPASAFGLSLMTISCGIYFGLKSSEAKLQAQAKTGQISKVASSALSTAERA